MLNDAFRGFKEKFKSVHVSIFVLENTMLTDNLAFQNKFPHAIKGF